MKTLEKIDQKHSAEGHIPKNATPLEVVVIYSFLIGQGLVLLYSIYLAISGIVSLVAPNIKPPLLPVYWGVFAVGYAMTIYGVSLWNHRMATHQAFKAPTWLRYIIAGCGAMAAQGYFRNWLGDHHEHHAHAEVPCHGASGGACDPHSPRDGFWHAFAGWLVKHGARDEHPHWKNADAVVASIEDQLRSPQLTAGHKEKLMKRLVDARDRIINRSITRFYDKTLPLWLTLSILVPGLVCWLIVGSPASFALGCVIAGFGRMAAVNVATSLVNSYEHMHRFPGNYRHFEWPSDDSHNNWFIALFNPEGFHWWHHVFPKAANHGIFWWERMLDHSANMIWVLEKVGLAWDVRWVTVKDALDLQEKLQNKMPKQAYAAVSA